MECYLCEIEFDEEHLQEWGGRKVCKACIYEMVNDYVGFEEEEI